MATRGITWQGIFGRFVAAVVLVFATYNPEGYSYYHWGIKHLPQVDPLRVFAGVVLLVGWTVFIRATLRSLGPFGLFLAVAFFGTLLWLIVDLGGGSRPHRAGRHLSRPGRPVRSPRHRHVLVPHPPPP